MATDYLPLVDNYVNVKPGDAIRLLPFGTLVKNGKRREITPEYAHTFKLPHFRPPVKLGSHEETTPAGGHIVGLEVRADGLWGLTTRTDKGERSFEDGDFRYLSPEILWEDGALENPQDGSMMRGPLIVGAALTHTPHLGEATAFYEAVPNSSKGAGTMNEDMVSVPKGFWDWLTGWLPKKDDAAPADPAPPPTPATEPDKLTALAAERDDFRAKYEALEAAKAQADKLAAIRAEFATDQYGAAYVELGKVPEAAEMMGRMDDEMRAWCMQTFRALSAQIDESKLTADPGATGNGGEVTNPKQAFNVAVLEKAATLKIDYNAALQIVMAEQPELFAAYKAA